nr:Zinc finger domain containing protein [Haemonchus contortus]
MRHIGRWHASQYRDGLEERIAANKWRSKDKPIDPLEKLETNAPSTQQCSDLLSRLLCTQCGMTFDNRTDLDRHHTNTHRPLKCKHCGEVFDGYGNLRAHELRQRAQSFECSCGASFSRLSELRIHRDSCRKRGSFLCIVCDRLFTQRVQLDRHWKKEHFVSAQCAECGWIAAAPLRKAEHALEVHKKDMDRPSDTESCNLPVEFKNTSPSVEECKNSNNSGDQKSHNVLPSRKELFVDCSGTSSIASGSGSETNNSLESALDREHEKSHHASIDLPKAAPVREEAYLNVVLSIPNHVVDDFYFGDRLPDEIRQLFPELTHARVCIVEPFVGQKRFLSLHIPVIRPPETSGQADRLLSVPIYV